VPESDHPFSPDHLTALFDLFGASDPTDPTVSSVPPARQQRPPGPLPDLEHDRQVLSWLACSSQLCSDVKGHLVDALLAWALEGRGYPQTTTILDEGQVRDLVEKMLKSTGRRIDINSLFAQPCQHAQARYAATSHRAG